MNISFKKSLLNNNLKNYDDLYLRCFRNHQLNTDYLDWLYNKNPDGKFIGIDCFDGKKLIGQVGGIPFEFLWNNKKLKILISINVCVDKNYRGNSLFSKMAKKLEIYAKEINFDGIIAIGNNSATPAWIKSIGLINNGKLDAFFGLGGITESNLNLNKDEYNFYSIWNNKKINWRINNPKNKTFTINNKIKSIYAITKYPFIKAYAPLIFYEGEIQLNSYENKNYLFVFLGKIGSLKSKNIIKIPEILKPSPLNFLYKFFNIKNNLQKNEVFFTFLDFDAF